MMIEQHVLVGIGLAIVLFISGLSLVPIALIIGASILIDIDHFFDYVFKFKKGSLAGINKYFRRKVILMKTTTPLPIFIFHNFETIIILSIASIFCPLMIYILAGVILHMTLDWLVMPTPAYPAIIKLSLILVLIENSRRKRGDPRW